MDERELAGPWFCPWCDAVIYINGQPATSEHEAYWHTYDHRDKGKHAESVLDHFYRLDVVETDKGPDPDGQ